MSRATIRTIVFLLCSFALLLAATSAPAAPAGDEPLTKTPVLVSKVDAVYPAGAREKRVEAMVIMEIDIDERGAVEATRVVSMQGGAGFDFAGAAQDAVKRFRFEPAEAGGKPVPVTISYKYTFAMPKTGGVTVTVENRATGVKIPGAHVMVTRLFEGQWLRAEGNTAPDGTYAFSGLPPGDWQVDARAEGFARQKSVANVLPDQAVFLRVALEPPPTSDYDVLVEEEEAREEKGRVFVDPSTVLPNTPRASGVVIADTTGARGRRGGAGGRGGGGRGGGGGGGGRGGGGGGFGGGRGGGGGGFGGGGGGFGGRGARPAAPTGTTGTIQAGSDVVTVISGINGMDLRGLNPANTRVVLDGVDVPEAYHIGSIRPVIPPGMLTDAAFYPGSFPVEYGGSTAGLVLLTTNGELASRTTGYVDANWADSSVLIRTPLTKELTLTVSGQYSTLDRVMAGAIGNRSDVGLAGLPRYRDGEVKLVYQPLPTFKISLLGVASQDQLVGWFPGPGDPPRGSVTLDTVFYRGIATTEWTPSKDVTAKLTVGGGTDETFQQTPNFDLTTTKLQARPSVHYRVIKELSFDFGLQYLVEQVSGTLVPGAAPTPGVLTTSPSTLNQITARGFGAYVGSTYEPWAGFQILPGFRVEHYTQTDETVVDPRAVVRWELLKGRDHAQSLAAKIAIGQYHQPPSLLQASTQIGNPALTSENSIHYLGGVEWKPVKETLLEVDGFYVDEQNVIVKSTQVTQRNGVNVPEVFSNGGSGETRGFEVFAQQALFHHMEGWLYYTFAVSNLSTVTGSSPLSPYDQTHVLGVALGYELPAGFKVRGRFLYATGFPTTSVTGSVFDSSTNQYVSTPGATLGDRTPDFSQLDLRVDKSWTLSRAKITAYLDVRNVYNRPNVVTPYAYNFDYSRSYARYGVPILPMTGARVDF